MSKTQKKGALLKSLVSKKKRRFMEDGFDLDLSYIQPRVIAMGYPSVGKEAMYRNPRSEVVRFLDKRHADHYKVYNLCSERSYEASVFHGRAARFPFDDHNCPPLRIIYELCADVSAYLKEDERNVVVLHCKAGKGRSGLMIACWLLYNHDWSTADEALSFYAAARTFNQKGVTIPSQIRYVHYFERALHAKGGYEVPESKLLLLKKLSLRDVPSMAGEWSVRIRAHGLTQEAATVLTWRGRAVNDALPLGITPVRGDIHVRVESKHHTFMFWFNTLFVDDFKLTLSKSEIDKANKDKALPDTFAVVMEFEEDSAEIIALQTRTNKALLGAKKYEYKFAESLMAL